MGAHGWTVAVALILLASGGERSSAEAPAVELVVIVNDTNRESVSAADLEQVFLRKTTHWDSGDSIIPINAPADSPARREFDRVVLGMSAEESARYWLNQRIRSGINAPREIEDANLAARLVGRLKTAIAYVPADIAVDHVRIVLRIRNGKVIAP